MRGQLFQVAFDVPAASQVDSVDEIVVVFDDDTVDL